MSKKEEQLKIVAAALNRYRKLNLNDCFDPADATSRPTGPQLEVIEDFGKIQHQYVTAGNQSGKTQLGARLTAWLFTESMPGWTRPERWGSEPLLLLVAGRTTKQVEETLWRKISSYLEEGTYQEVKVGNVLQKVINKNNGNTILFFSHHSEREAREKIQSFVAHFAWIDELPASAKLLEEMHRRVQARQGGFLSTFTPKAVNSEIRRIVDASIAPAAKKYKFSMLDNPIYTEEDKQKILQSLDGFSTAYRNCILYGDWLSGDSAVYYFDQELMVRAPENYSPSWRHVESSDPALQSAHGLIVAAEDPATNFWYIIKADYLTDIFYPDKLVEEVALRTRYINLVRRIADGHESWYIHTASQKGIHYISPYKKNERKSELIKNFQTALGTKLFIAPWCTDLIDEITSCHWSETAEGKIAKGSRFHLIDASHYLVDLLPKPESTYTSDSWDVELRRGNDLRKKKEAKMRQLKALGNPRTVRGVWRVSRKRR